MPDGRHEECNAVYYWKTVFRPDSAELAFMRQHDVRRIYLRMFDVTETEASDAGDIESRVEPNATVTLDEAYLNALEDLLPDVEFVPVVYITLEALKAVDGHEGFLARNIVTMVRNMCHYNALPGVTELQLDCDWTASTENSYFTLCDSVKRCFKYLELPWRLSSTVRLHQLSEDVPPVDSGVLMVYNTGDFSDPDAENSILSLGDVSPYLDNLPGYPLHLDVAYPTYSWQLLFRDRRFVGLLNGLNLEDTVQFRRLGADIYGSLRYMWYTEDDLMMTGDIIREEQSEYETIAAVKSMIDKELSGRRYSNIIYHLDNHNLSKYTSDEIDEIFSRTR